MRGSRSRLSSTQQESIEQIVGRDRARFDERERRLYSHDVSVLPRALGLLAGRSLADGVVRPESEAELVELVRYAQAQRIPLVPRGKATSGYGGCVPADGGLVMDLTGLDGLFDVDTDALTVSVGAGTVWKDLEAPLRERGWDLRLYPTSAPASTVGGWLAQGGAGIGSHAYGWFAENVPGARVVTATGEVRELSGAALAGITDAEGTTGIITRVTLAVRAFRASRQAALSWPGPEGLSQALEMITQRKLPLWSFQFHNPNLARLSNATPHYLERAEPAVDLVEDQWSALLAYAAEDEAEVADALREVCTTTGGVRQSDALAGYLWAERFKPLRLKRLGPSLVPIEVVLPTTGLAAAVREIEHLIAAPMALEGVSVRGDQVVLLALIPHDERGLGFAFGHGFALTVLAAAERHGGRVHSTGRYFASRATQILGEDKLKVLGEARLEHDPNGILNPGKVFSNSSLTGTVMNAAAAVEPLVRRVATSLGQPLPPAERPSKKKFLPDVARHAYACAQCGYCVADCPQFQDGAWESSGPRGKWFLLKSVLEGQEHFDNQMRDIFGLCTECGKCDAACQLELPNVASWRGVKVELFGGILTRTS
jgi:FAD/FMN-containing dehydrogenase/ferredoxin